jgi:ribosomal protein S1
MKSRKMIFSINKKYITHSLPHKISNLRFGKEYTGRLTTKPYDFGMFIELEGYYTGLLHSSEFKDYNTVKREMRAGEEVTVYVKGVTMKKKQYRIILTSLEPNESIVYEI